MPVINVVDDDEGMRFMLKLMLERAGYDVVQAESGEECLERFDSLRPDLILLDVHMLGINGWDVCKQIKERIPANSVPISMLSGMKTEKDLRSSFEYAHADAFIKKPIDRRELLDTVKKLLEKSSYP